MADVAEIERPDDAAAALITQLPIDPSTPLYRVRAFRLLFITRVASTTAVQMLAVVVAGTSTSSPTARSSSDDRPHPGSSAAARCWWWRRRSRNRCISCVKAGRVLPSAAAVARAAAAEPCGDPGAGRW
jgi:hypothetical protein